jgi:methylated-DNA-[protein]-cysteine S-methyltransferase
MSTSYYSFFDSPLGPLYLRSDGHFLTALYMQNHKHWAGPDTQSQQSAAPFADVCLQLTEYFAGQRREFDLPLKLAGTPFQQRVWQELACIPYGVTITYAQLAQRVGQATASRAVGAANGRNPISILVPCHRVIGSNGQLTGYGGGMENKRWLLDWEQSQMGSVNEPSNPLANNRC